METVLIDYGIMILLLMGWVCMAAAGAMVPRMALGLPGRLAVVSVSSRGVPRAVPPGSGPAQTVRWCPLSVERCSLKKSLRFLG